MKNKKAIELSMNFLVILIISIVIFAFGIRFIYTLSKEATNLRELSVEDLDKSISDLVCEGSERVCIGVERKTIKKGKFDVFGIKILNINRNHDFIIEVGHPNPPGYKKNKDPIPSTSQLVISPEERAIEIEQNDEKNIAIGVQVPPNAVSGTYILNVNIRQGTNNYVPVQKLYVEVP